MLEILNYDKQSLSSTSGKIGNSTLNTWPAEQLKRVTIIIIIIIVIDVVTNLLHQDK